MCKMDKFLTAPVLSNKNRIMHMWLMLGHDLHQPVLCNKCACVCVKGNPQSPAANNLTPGEEGGRLKSIKSILHSPIDSVLLSSSETY